MVIDPICGMTMNNFTKEFENYWAKYSKVIIDVPHSMDGIVKLIAWHSWRTGREKLYEETRPMQQASA
jgi:hypothetical protein